MTIRTRYKPILFFSAFFLVLFLPVIYAFTVSQTTGDDITGIWLTQSTESMVEVAKSGNSYTGKIYWLKFPDDPATKKPKLDVHNPDPKLRSRPIIGMNLMINFTYSAKDKTGSGEIYDPKSGNTYNCKATLEEKNTLKVHGYIGASWMGLGRTEVWKRIK